MAATYQIYALKYGERETKEGQFFFREASQKPLTLHFFISCGRFSSGPTLITQP